MVYLLFLANLLVTSIVEGALIFLWSRKWDFVYYSLLGNLLTNPALNLLLLAAVHTLGVSSYGAGLLLLETAAVLVEAYIYLLLGNFKFPKALLLSAVLNLASFLAGFFVDRIFII